MATSAGPFGPKNWRVWNGEDARNLCEVLFRIGRIKRIDFFATIVNKVTARTFKSTLPLGDSSQEKISPTREIL